MDSENVVFIHNGILLSPKEEILSFACKWMELENIILSEVTRLRKPKISCSPSYMGYNPKRNAAILLHTGHIKGRLHKGGIGQGKETKNLNMVDAFTL
jgi:hypothetical protein